MLTIVPAMPALAEGASIESGGNCFGIVPDAQGNFSGAQVIGNYISRSTKSGITNFTCHFDLTEDEAPSIRVRASNFACQTPMGPTTMSRISASPGGQMVMTCSIRISKAGRIY